jgi:ankyrin repeat protein
MTLLALPTEIIQLIGDQLDDASLNALTQAHHHMHQLLNERLYRRDVIKPHSRSLAWVTWALTRREATARKGTVLCAIEAGSHLKRVPDNFHTALAHAASQGYADIVKALLTLDGINPNFGGRFEPPLLLAAERGPNHRAIVKMLLAAVNIDPNVRDRWGNTPLHFACSWENNVPLMKRLLARKDVDPKILKGPHHPLMLTKDLVVKLFLARHVDIANHLLERKDVKLDLPDNEGRTPLFIACASGNLPMVCLLLKKGVNPNARDNGGCTPLAHVCGSDWDRVIDWDRIINVIKKVVELLLSHPDTDPCAVDKRGASALYKCSRNKSLPDDTRNAILGLLQAHPRYISTKVMLSPLPSARRI